MQGYLEGKELLKGEPLPSLSKGAGCGQRGRWLGECRDWELHVSWQLQALTANALQRSWAAVPVLSGALPVETRANAWGTCRVCPALCPRPTPQQGPAHHLSLSSCRLLRGTAEDEAQPNSARQNKSAFVLPATVPTGIRCFSKLTLEGPGAGFRIQHTLR